MPWTTKNYPNSWKNFDPLLRKKAIDIANAMLADGYKEENIIPIATSQAQKWYENATPAELKELEEKDVTKHAKPKGPSGARLMEKDVIVRYQPEQKQWEVISDGALQADSLHPTKKEAVIRAREIAGKRGTRVIEKKKSES